MVNIPISYSTSLKRLISTRMLKIEIDDLKMLGLKYVASAIPGKSLKRKSTVTEEELKSKPEALKSLYHSPGYKKNQLVLCKNCPAVVVILE